MASISLVMRSVVLVSALSIVVSGAGCGEATNAAPAAAAASAQPDPLAALSLDAGKRWRSDDHTRQSVAAMAAAVQAAAGDQASAATIALGKRLQALADELIAGCTMQGAEHEALHVYLTALLPRFQRMAGADAALSLAARKEVASILARFHDYFE